MKKNSVYNNLLFRAFAILAVLIETGAAMIFGTYNIRYDTAEDLAEGNSWSRRAPVVAGLIRFHDFDVLCTQEARPNQMKDLRDLLPDHSAVSYGRDDGDGAGEHMGIFYRTEMFTLTGSGRFWLSENPAEPGRGWDADLPRICTWAKLKRKNNGSEFAVFSLHLDHRGMKSRPESIKLVLRMIDELAPGMETYLAGDFNTDQNSDAYKLLAASEKLVDASISSKFSFIPNGTANRFDPNSATSSRIDHIFVSKNIPVRRFGVLTDSYRAPKEISPSGDSESKNFPAEVKFKDWKAHLPSDHFPVLIETVEP